MHATRVRAVRRSLLTRDLQKPPSAAKITSWSAKISFGAVRPGRIQLAGGAPSRPSDRCLLNACDLGLGLRQRPGRQWADGDRLRHNASLENGKDQAPPQPSTRLTVGCCIWSQDVIACASSFIQVRAGCAANAVEEWGQFMRAAEPSTDVSAEQTAPDGAQNTRKASEEPSRLLRPRRRPLWAFQATLFSPGLSPWNSPIRSF
jgi:hypothetical protein